MTTVGLILVAAPAALFVYAYLVYPLLLRALLAVRPPRPQQLGSAGWPMITVTIPAHNEERLIGQTLESVLRADYPAGRCQIIVISDASTDRTDEIVGQFAPLGVELLRLPERRGKTAAENAAAPLLRGEVVVNLDASIRILPTSLKPLVAVFADPTVGVASGRDVSVGDLSGEGNRAESGYVGYEMWVRGLETRLGSIPGASGCFYAFRRQVHEVEIPPPLSRDFADVLAAREMGWRSVSVDAATCVVPRTRSLRTEFRRKTRTMARGMQTLWHWRHLMNPLRHGGFALMLVSHKLCRWLVYAALPFAAVGLVLLAIEHPVVRPLLVLAVVGLALGLTGIFWPEGKRVPALFALPGYLVASGLAGVFAWAKVIARDRNPIWEPTRRPA